MTALEEVGHPDEGRTLDMAAAAQSSAEYLAINRNGKVLVMMMDGELLTETRRSWRLFTRSVRRRSC